MAIIALHCPHIKVIVADINKRQIEKWNSDVLPIYEPRPGRRGQADPRQEPLLHPRRGRRHQGERDDIRIRQHANQDTRPRRWTGGQPQELVSPARQLSTSASCMQTGRLTLPCSIVLFARELAARNIAKVADGPKIVIEKSTLPVLHCSQYEPGAECQ